MNTIYPYGALKVNTFGAKTAITHSFFSSLSFGSLLERKSHPLGQNKKKEAPLFIMQRIRGISAHSIPSPRTNDILSDSVTRIKNGYVRKLEKIALPNSRKIQEFWKLLYKQGIYKIDRSNWQIKRAMAIASRKESLAPLRRRECEILLPQKKEELWFY